MTRYRAAAATVCAAMLAIGGTGASAGAAPPTGSVAGNRVEQVFRDRLDASSVPSGAFAIVHADGTTDGRGVGRSGGAPITSRTPFVIGSTTKSFTALAVLQLVDRGAVDLDAPVLRYVPELRLAGGELTERITVRHLLQQTSGLPEAAGGPVLTSAADGTPADAVRELRGVRLTSAPGSRWQYSNGNYVLAGLVVERASGLSYADYVQRRIFQPLGMTRSFAAIEPARQAGLSSGHRFWFGFPVNSGPTYRPGVLAAGYLISTAEDLGRYLRMYLRGGVAADGRRIVSATGLRTMLDPGPVAHLGPWADGHSARYAMGWFVGGPWRQPATFHPGNSPDSTAMIALVPERGLAVATLIGAAHEVPVPGNPSATDRISRNVVDAALGERVANGQSLHRFYAVFDVLVLALIAAAAWGLYRAGRAVRRGHRTRHRVLALIGPLSQAVIVAVLVVLPGSIGYGWAGLRQWAPDLWLVLVVLIGLLR